MPPLNSYCQQTGELQENLKGSERLTAALKPFEKDSQAIDSIDTRSTCMSDHIGSMSNGKQETDVISYQPLVAV